jgi:hypothetical protein
VDELGLAVSDKVGWGIWMLLNMGTAWGSLGNDAVSAAAASFAVVCAVMPMIGKTYESRSGGTAS